VHQHRVTDEAGGAPPWSAIFELPLVWAPSDLRRRAVTIEVSCDSIPPVLRRGLAFAHAKDYVREARKTDRIEAL